MDREYVTAFINIDLTAVAKLGRAQQHRLWLSYQELAGPPPGLRDDSGATWRR